MKKIFSTIIISLLIFYNLTCKLYASEGETSPYSLKTEFSLYKERVKNICEQYKTKKELLKVEDVYEELVGSYSLDEVKNKYKSLMNDIYKCGLLSTQEKSLLLIKEDLTKKNKILLEKLGPKIDSQIDKLDAISSTLSCIKSNDKSSIIKLNLLKQTTYESCKYLAYLEYLREYNNKILGLVKENKEKYTNSELIYINNEKLNEIEEEINHTYKVFPMAFHAFTEYENNISIHFLLELIKDDYTILRDKLHEVLNPINQVVYKISNAMRK